MLGKALSVIIFVCMLLGLYYFGNNFLMEADSQNVSTEAKNETTEQKQVINLKQENPTKLTEMSPVGEDIYLPELSSEETAASTILSEADTLPKTITLRIDDFSADNIADLVLKSGRFYYINYTVSTKGKNQTIEVKPAYKIAYEILYADKIKDTSILSPKARAVHEWVTHVIDEIIHFEMTQYDMVLAVHDYIITNTEYDGITASSNASGVNGGESISNLHDSYTPFGIAAYGKGVCQAYSELMLIFMSMLGIEAAEVTGMADGESHSWNRVKIDGDYYNIDLTWDDPKTEGNGIVSYAYFNLTDEMLSKTHNWDKDSMKKCVSLTYNYFNYNNLVVKSQEEFESIITKGIEEGLPHVELRLDGIKEDQLSYDFVGRVTDKTSIEVSYADKQSVLRVYLK